MLNALSDAVAQCAKKEGGLPARIEGVSDFGWVVVDCGDIVVHLFSPTQREYYHSKLYGKREKPWFDYNRIDTKKLMFRFPWLYLI